MILSNINHNFLITETDQYGIYKEFSYVDKKGNQRKRNPTILYLGNKPGAENDSGERNMLICGIALDYLNAEEYSRLRSHLPAIMAVTGKARYRVGERLLPDIFAGDGVADGSAIPRSKKSGGGNRSGGGGAFRTYVKSRIDGLVNKKMMALKVEPEDQDKAQKLSSEDGYEWEELPEQTQRQYLEQASRKRGEEEIEYETFKKDIKPEELEPEDEFEPKAPKPTPTVTPTTKTQSAAPIVTPKPATKQMTPIPPEIETPEPQLPPTKDVSAKLKKAPQPQAKTKIQKAQPTDQNKNLVDKETKEQTGAEPNEDVP